ncbi:MAG: PIN domain-containing protein [Pseudomonadota bacterium]
MNKKNRVYWDACTWIAYLNQEKEVERSDGSSENWFRMCDQVLRSAKEERLEIATSAFTLAEVCKPPQVKEIGLDKLSLSFEQPYIFLLPVDAFIGRQAQHIQLSEPGIKPADAIHLASAQRAKATELHTFDGKLLGLGERMLHPDGTPLKICKPTQGQPEGPLI